LFHFYLKFQCSNIHEHFLGEISSGIPSMCWGRMLRRKMRMNLQTQWRSYM
jgi:hypothetical protein